MEEAAPGRSATGAPPPCGFAPLTPSGSAGPALVVLGPPGSDPRAVYAALRTLGVHVRSGGPWAGARWHAGTTARSASRDRLEALLARLGGSWDVPPPGEPRALRGGGDVREGSRSPLAGEREAAVVAASTPGRRQVADTPEPVTEVVAAMVADAVGSPVPVALGDPRLSLLGASFWDAGRPPTVLVADHPLEVAGALARDHGLSLPLGLSLWEEYLRQSLAALLDVPLLVVSEGHPEGDALVADLRSLLGNAGVEPARGEGTTALDLAGAFLPDLAASDSRATGVDPIAAGARPEGPGDLASEQAGVPWWHPPVGGGPRGPEAWLGGWVDRLCEPSQEALRSLLQHSAGLQLPWGCPPLPPGSPWVQGLLADRRAAPRPTQRFVGSDQALAGPVALLEALALALAGPDGGGDEPGSGEPGRTVQGFLGPLRVPAGARSETPGGLGRLQPPTGAIPDAATDTVAYQGWWARRYPASGPDGTVRLGPDAPTIDVVVPVYHPDPDFLRRCVESVCAQTYPAWTLSLCDDTPGDPAVRALGRAFRHEARIRWIESPTNQGISAATNAAAALGSGEWIAFLDHDDELAPHALERVARAVSADPQLDVAYSDEDKLDPRGGVCQPALKPDYSPDYLLSTAYFCHLTVVRRTIFDRLGGLRSAFDGSQDYDLSLRATEIARRVGHIPDVLYHWRIHASSAADAPDAKPWAHQASERALADALERRGERARVEQSPYAGIYHVRREPPEGVSARVILRSGDDPRRLRRAVGILLADAGATRATLTIVQDVEIGLETERLLTALVDDGAELLRSDERLGWPGAAALATRTARGAGRSGEVLVFCDAGTVAASPGWLDALVEHAARPEIAAAGCRLLDTSGRVRHAGLVVGLEGLVGAAFAGLAGVAPGYATSAHLTLNRSAVSPRALATRLGLASDLGFDAGLGDTLAAADYCLRAAARGRRTVFTPLAELVLDEPAPEGSGGDWAVGAEGARRFAERWARLLEEGDPYWNSNLSRVDPVGRLPRPHEASWKDLVNAELGRSPLVSS